MDELLYYTCFPRAKCIVFQVITFFDELFQLSSITSKDNKVINTKFMGIMKGGVGSNVKR